MTSIMQPQQCSGERAPTPESKARRASPLTWTRNAWQWFNALPLWIQVIVWALLAIVFAGPNILLLYVPVVLGVWLWETSQPLTRLQASGSAARTPAIRASRLDLGRWLCHLAEMVVAMYFGMLVYMALVRPIAMGIGLGSLVAGDLSYVWMIVFMVAPMMTLMRVQGHGWRMADEMALGMVIPVIVCFALVRLGICRLTPLLSWLTPRSVYTVAHDGMLLGMIAVMIYRRGMFTHVPESMMAHTHAGDGTLPADSETREGAHAIRSRARQEETPADPPKTLLPMH